MGEFFEEYLFPKESMEEILKVIQMYNLQDVYKDDVLYKEGDAAEFVYLIREGQFSITQSFHIKDHFN